MQGNADPIAKTSQRVTSDWRCPGYSPAHLDTLSVVVKITERCNIDCTYCHVFNGSDDSWTRHPKYMSQTVFHQTAGFLRQGVQSLPNLQKVRVVLQGGEPMMMRPRDMDAGLAAIRSALSGLTELEFVMQTNGMLVRPEWLALIEKYRIAVGVSLDGPPDIHDRRRIDHAGAGTYTRVVAGLRMLQRAAQSGSIVEPTVLAVIDPESDPRAVYRHLTHDLGVRTVNFLLPKNSHDDLKNVNAAAYGPWLCSALDAWIEDDDTNIDVRIFRCLLWTFLGKHTFSQAGDNATRDWESVICVASNGALGPDDEYRAIPKLWQGFQPFDVRAVTLNEFLDSHGFHILNRARRAVSAECSTCLWRPVCGGGALVNRYDTSNEFDNVSWLCGSLQQLYGRVVEHLARNGLDWQQSGALRSS